MANIRSSFWQFGQALILICILAIQCVWLWEEVVKPKQAIRQMHASLQRASSECRRDMDYQRRLGNLTPHLNPRTSDYLARTFVVSNRPCKEKKRIINTLLASNVSRAEIQLIDSSADDGALR